MHPKFCCFDEKLVACILNDLLLIMCNIITGYEAAHFHHCQCSGCIMRYLMSTHIMGYLMSIHIMRCLMSIQQGWMAT